jgi:hypothetical protein
MDGQSLHPSRAFPQNRGGVAFLLVSNKNSSCTPILNPALNSGALTSILSGSIEPQEHVVDFQLLLSKLQQAGEPGEKEKGERMR